MEIILGIDPGLHKTGWAIIAKHGRNNSKYISSGLIQTDPRKLFYDRILHLDDELLKIISQYLPKTCAIEETYINSNAQSSLKLGQARGAIILTLSKAGLNINEYASRLVKKTIVGVGMAEKEQIKKMVKLLLPNSDPKSEDEADAIAVALCHSYHLKI